MQAAKLWQYYLSSYFNFYISYLPSGPEGNRTPDLLNAIQTLYQLSYEPFVQLRISDEELRIEKLVAGFNNSLRAFISVSSSVGAR